jgi:hypothetical protein
VLYLNREKEEDKNGKLRQKCKSGMEGNPPPVDLRAVCYVVSDNNDDNESEQQTQDNIKDRRDRP